MRGVGDGSASPVIEVLLLRVRKPSPLVEVVSGRTGIVPHQFGVFVGTSLPMVSDSSRRNNSAEEVLGNSSTQVNILEIEEDIFVKKAHLLEG